VFLTFFLSKTALFLLFQTKALILVKFFIKKAEQKTKKFVCRQATAKPCGPHSNPGLPTICKLKNPKLGPSTETRAD
jgi:hypothetical protein